MKDLVTAVESPPPSRNDWLTAVDKVLRGKDFDTLVTHTVDDLSIQPLYTGDDIGTLSDESGFPGGAPYVRGERGEARPEGAWDIRSVIDVGSVGDANRAVLAELEGGASSVELVVSTDPTVRGVGVRSAADLAAALDGVLFDVAPVGLRGGGPVVAGWLAELWAKNPPIGGSFGLDPIGQLQSTGSLPTSVDAALSASVELAGRVSGVRTFTASGVAASSAGASEYQEIAATIAAGVVYLRALVDAGRGSADLVLEVTADVDVFATIAKLRALRHCWSTVLDAADLDPTTMTVQAVSAPRWLTVVDPWVNLLRGTAAAFGAVIGGADTVSVAPFADGAQGRRLARTTQLLLQDESGIGRVTDPAGGSWYVESLTDDIARRAWELFQTIEAAGGILGFDLDATIRPVRDERSRRIATRRQPITGVSEFPLLDERRPEPVAVTVDDRPALDLGDGTTPAVSTPLSAHRLSEPFEALRAQPNAPTVFLANLGRVADYTARATFAANFFAAGGLPTIDDTGYATVETLEAAFAASGCSIACLCSNDSVYSEMGTAAAAALRDAGATTVLLAGRPPDVSGIDQFIYVGADVIGVLTSLHEANR